MVEWKKLGGIANLVRGKVISKDYIRDHEGLYPVYSSQTANDGILGSIDSYMFDGDFLTWTTDGAYAGTIFRRKGKFNITNVCGLVDLTDKQVNQDFLYYWLSFVAKDYVNEGMGNPKLMSNVASTIRIPVPSLAEQSRIVGILDTFTASIENLKQQIAQRRKQYEHYRDQLLDLEGKEGVEMKMLGEICMIKNGYTPSTKNPDFWNNGSLPWFTLEDIRKNGRVLVDAIKHITPLGVKKGGLFPKDSIIVSTTATIGEYAIIKTDFLCNQQITCLSIKEICKKQLLPKFLYYLADGIGKWCKQNVNGGGSLLIVSTSKLQKKPIPVPSLQDQSRIVSILDTFEASIANLEQQLAQRERQYEYYRNKLLTFE